MRAPALRLALVAAGGLAAVSLLSATAAPALPTIRLDVGRSAFWNGGYVESEVAGLAGPKACAVAHCFSYPIQVTSGGAMLRVAIDTPDRSNQFELDLLDPSGTQVATRSNTAQSQFDMEVYASNPVAGTWTARVVPMHVQNAAFRLRAKLEAATPVRHAKTALLPDLEVTPPYEFTFVAPANPANV